MAIQEKKIHIYTLKSWLVTVLFSYQFKVTMQPQSVWVTEEYKYVLKVVKVN